MLARAALSLLPILVASTLALSQEDRQLDAQFRPIAAAHHGKLALYAHNLRTGQTASLSPDLPVKTASTIKLGILLDAAEQIRAGHAALAEKLVLEHANQVEGSGVLGELTAPLTLTLGDTLTLMVVLSDNTATNMAIDRLGLEHINADLAGCRLETNLALQEGLCARNGPDAGRSTAIRAGQDHSARDGVDHGAPCHVQVVSG